ncbi:VOC family protein [Brachybacterium hainanense]|uniref:VOC family protein n=1 Tax=Brachybacterium hainanense TaxID=1541174 RepID=A0ABV6RJP4_9MICO
MEHTRELSISASYLPHTDAEASLAFYRDLLGFEVRMDVGGGQLRWITMGPPGQEDTAVVLHPVLSDDGITEAEHAALLAIIAKGSYFGINLATPVLDVVFARLVEGGADVVQEPMDQDYGIRDAAVRDPAGNQIRLQQLPGREGVER